MWVITDEQKKNIGISIQQQRKHRTFRILSKEEEFAKMDREELKEKIRGYVSLVADRKIIEEVLLEFVRKCLRDPEILERFPMDWIIKKIEDNII